MGQLGDVFIGDGRHVGVGYILEAADACSQDEPFGEGVHLFTETVGELVIGACAEFTVEDNCLDNHCHVGEVEGGLRSVPTSG